MRTKFFKIIFLILILSLNFSLGVYAQKATNLKTRSQFREGVYRKYENYLIKSGMPNAQKKELTESLRKSMRNILNQSGISDNSLRRLNEIERNVVFEQFLNNIIKKSKTVDPNNIQDAFKEIKSGGSIRNSTRKSFGRPYTLAYLRRIDNEIDQYAKTVRHKETTIIPILQFEDSYIIYNCNRKTKKNGKKELPLEEDLIEYFKKNKSLYDNNKYILIPDNNLVNKYRFQNIFKDKTVIFLNKDKLYRMLNSKEYGLKSFSQSLENFNTLIKSRFTKKDIEIYNLLPKNKEQANKMGLHKWNSKDIKTIQDSIRNEVKKFKLDSNVVTNKWEWKFTHNKKDKLFKFIQEKDGRIKVLICFAHKGEKIMINDGKSISHFDITKLPPNIFRNKKVILYNCDAALETKTGSYVRAILDKGATNVIAPAHKVDTSTLPKLIELITKSIGNDKDGYEINRSIKQISEEFLDMSKIYPNNSYYS